mmetsp:Transcript_53569/g.148974  ORF Transcript_53569/g.148974 Transcript_53569/m.148974 type:complete len:512 (-) Transcript_53569:298-1833(-)
MPLYEEKFICPFSIRFSQARIRPTFQDGRVVEKSLHQVEAIPWPLENEVGAYDVLLDAPFPPIEIIRWWPKMRDRDGLPLCDEDGSTIIGEACWFTFDNRRLYCLQAAAAKQWPRRVAAVVHVMRDLPISKSTPRKFRTTDMGNSVNIARRYDPVPRSTWNWAEATGVPQSGSTQDAAETAAVEAVHADAVKESLSDLVDVPADLFANRPNSSSPTTGMARTTQSKNNARRGPRAPQEFSPPAKANERPKAPPTKTMAEPFGAREAATRGKPAERVAMDRHVPYENAKAGTFGGTGLTVAELALKLNAKHPTAAYERAPQQTWQSPQFGFRNQAFAAAATTNAARAWAAQDIEAQRWAIAAALAGPSMSNPMDVSAHYRAASMAAHAASWAAASHRAALAAAASRYAMGVPEAWLPQQRCGLGGGLGACASAGLGAGLGASSGVGLGVGNGLGLGLDSTSSLSGLDTTPPLAGLDLSAESHGSATGVAGAAACGADRPTVGGEVDADCVTD